MEFSFGSNELPASASYNERREYIKNYSTGLSDHANVDYWYDHLLFGRIDRNQDAIYPASGSALIKRVLGDAEVYALNFVSDAFVSMKLDIQAKLSNGSINAVGPGFLSNGLNAQRGWRDPRQDYFTYMRSFYDDFVLSFMANPDVNSTIMDFEDFVNQFTTLIDRITLLRPFTMSEYILSNLSSPAHTGLVIEIDAESDHGEDLEKIANYNNDNHFEIYRQAAANHGFNVDKNAPWRLVAIPYSEGMNAQMSAYDITYDNMVDKLYAKASFKDMTDLQFYMREFYNVFVTQFPKVSVPLLPGKNTKNNLTKIYTRVTLSEEEYNSNWIPNDNLWTKLYIYIRAKETNRDWDQNKFKKVFKKASQFIKYSDATAAHKYINKEVRRPWGEDKALGKYRRGNFRF
jgi:hypothetical protein